MNRIERVVDRQAFDDRAVGPTPIRGWPDVNHRVVDPPVMQSIYGYRRCSAGARSNRVALGVFHDPGAVERQVRYVENQWQQFGWAIFLSGRLGLEVATADPCRHADDDAPRVFAPQ